MAKPPHAQPDHHQPEEELRRVKAAFRRQYPLRLELPAEIVSKVPEKKIRTKSDLIQWRLLEHGVATLEEFQDVNQVEQSLQQFRADLLQSGCYQDVQVNIVKGDAKIDSNLEATGHKLQIELEEKNWYRLYVGGGIKQQGFGEATPFSLDRTPAVQIETSIGLSNIAGCLDTTTLQYDVNHNSISTWNLFHERPLYAAIPQWRGGLGWLKDQIIAQPNGTQYSLSMRAALETMDFEYTRSYREFQRLLSVRWANQFARRPELASSPVYTGLEWNLLFRDVIPRPHATLPFALDASPEIVQQAGPSLKHSLQWEYRNNSTNHRFNPTQGSNLRLKAELATPPGDVGFWKAQGGWATHFPIIFNNDLLCCHASFSTGLLRPLLFGGMCNPPNVSDRFFCGGPLQLRGFLPSGIGPRSNQFPNGDGATAKTSSLTPNGDSLGGDFFYMATLATSVGLGGLQQHSSFLRDYVRCFAFVNVGTLTGLQNTVSWNTLLHSSRVAVGAGCSVATPAGRLELTYAVPLRYSPRDARRSIQFGLGFSFD